MFPHFHVLSMFVVLHASTTDRPNPQSNKNIPLEIGQKRGGGHRGKLLQTSEQSFPNRPAGPRDQEEPRYEEALKFLSKKKKINNSINYVILTGLAVTSLSANSNSNLSTSFNSGLNTYGLNNSYASNSPPIANGAGGSHSLGYQGGNNGSYGNKDLISWG